LIQNSITSYHKNQGRTRGKKEKREKNRSRLKEKGAKTVLQRFFAKLNGSMKLLRSEPPRIIFEKVFQILALKLMWYRFDFSRKIVVFIVQSGLKLQYDFSLKMESGNEHKT